MLLGVLAWVDPRRLRRPRRCPTRAARPPPQAIADNILSNYLVPFLALCFVLLAAAVGAIVLARKD